MLNKIKHECLHANSNSGIVTNRAVEVIEELAKVSSQSGITGDILLITLHEELNNLSIDFITQNDLDINSYIKVIIENILYPAKNIFESCSKEDDCAMNVLAQDPDPYKYSKLLINGHVSCAHLDEIRTCFIYSSRRNNDLLSKYDKMNLSDSNPDPLLIWQLIGVVYFALHSLISNERNCNVN